MLKPLLEIENLCFRPTPHAENILDDLSLNLHSGDFTIILGSNGCGKSSLLKCINGRNKVTSGTIRLNGNTIDNCGIETIARQVATISQHADLSTFGSLTVQENLEVAGVNNGKEYLQQFFPSLVERFTIATGQLSGGQRQTLALAMCAVNTPDLLILDEQTSALDPKSAQHIMEVTQSISHSRSHMAIIMATHSLDIALSYGNKLIVMHKGKSIFNCDKRIDSVPSKTDLFDLYN